MANIPIDGFSSILHAYYDGGDSYPGHKKYSLLKRFVCQPEGSLNQSWCSFNVDVKSQSSTCIYCENMSVDISDYDRFRLFAMIANFVDFEVYCNDILVISGSGKDLTVYDGEKVDGIKNAASIKYIFKNKGHKDTVVTLHYLGLLRDDTRKVQPFNDEWEGFFEKNADYKLFNNNYLTEEELENLRKKVKTPLYSAEYNKQKEKAYLLMNEIPEEKISRTVRPYHRAPFKISGAATLALVGQIERNSEMMKMACRYALSLACCEYWCADPMETVPMVAWHHRSFDEADITTEISMVLSLAGGVLSWHGRNYLYNMIIMKGLPRMEADFMTMDYIYTCNQGIVFMAGYIQGLLAVVNNYPRYKSRIEEAKKLLEKMMNSFLNSDGSYEEGAVYWRFVMTRCLICIYLISKYEGNDITAYWADILIKTSDYGLSMLDNDAKTFTFGDSGRNATYRLSIAALFYKLTGNSDWAYYFDKFTCDGMLDMMIASTVDIPDISEKKAKEFIKFDEIGFTRIERENIIFAVMSGPSNFTHAHCDKGSFIIYNGDHAVVDDCSDSYTVSEAADLYKSKNHSLTLPIINGKYVEQLRGSEYCAPVICSSYENNVFQWKTDCSQIWNTRDVKKCIRTVFSDKPNEFVITDEFEFCYPSEIEFRLNIACPDEIEAEPLNWNPVKRDIVPLYNLNGWSVQQLQMKSDKKTKHEIITKIIIKN